jgi:hypothetical protein
LKNQQNQHPIVDTAKTVRLPKERSPNPERKPTSNHPSSNAAYPAIGHEEKL